MSSRRTRGRPRKQTAAPVLQQLDVTVVLTRLEPEKILRWRTGVKIEEEDEICSEASSNLFALFDEGA